MVAGDVREGSTVARHAAELKLHALSRLMGSERPSEQQAVRGRGCWSVHNDEQAQIRYDE